MKRWRVNEHKKEGGSGTHEWEQKSEQRRQCAVNRRLSRHLRRIKTGITIKVRRRYLPSSLLNLLPVCLYVCAHMLHFCPVFFFFALYNKSLPKGRENQVWHLHFNKHANSQKKQEHTELWNQRHMGRAGSYTHTHTPTHPPHTLMKTQNFIGFTSFNSS